MRTEEEIRKAIKDSEKYYEETYPDMKPNQPVIALEDVKRGVKALAVANEICTLNWVLGKGKMNCYGKEEDSEAKP